MEIPEIRNRHGERIDAEFHPGDREDRLLIIGHGVTGNKDRPLVVAVAEGLSRLGWPCLRISFTGNGGSEGDFEDSTISKECADLVDVIDQVPEGVEVAYAGHSMGGAVGLKVASVDERIRVLVSLAGMVRTSLFCDTEFGEVEAGEGNMWDEEGCPLSKAYVDDMHKIGDLLEEAAGIDIPWLLIHGTEDDVVLPADSRDAFATAEGERQLLEVEGAGHSFGDEFHPQVVAAIDRWLRRHFS